MRGRSGGVLDDARDCGGDFEGVPERGAQGPGTKVMLWVSS